MTVHPHPPHEAPIRFELPTVRIALAMLLVLGFVGISPVGASVQSAGFYVEATGHILADPFLSYWVDNDGTESLGLPVTDVVSHNGRAAQYFQYGVLVLKRNGSASRARAGVDLLDELRGDPRMVEGRRAPSPRTTQALPMADVVQQTRSLDGIAPLVVDPDLLSTWSRFGGVATIGEPISPTYRVGNERTQWFEFGRIDLGPDGAIRAEVGRELALRSGVPTDPEGRGHRPLFDPSRFVTFTGDGAIPNAVGPFDPARLRIPAIQVDAGIEITTVQDGVMTNPTDPWKAGWYAGFARPGDWTNTVIAGHRDWWGYGPVVFWNLGLVRPGDKIYLMAADGSGATYIVESTTLVPRTVDPQTIINDVGYEALTLITCGGAWTGAEYTDRIIVRAYRV